MRFPFVVVVVVVGGTARFAAIDDGAMAFCFTIALCAIFNRVDESEAQSEQNTSHIFFIQRQELGAIDAKRTGSSIKESVSYQATLLS